MTQAFGGALLSQYENVDQVELVPGMLRRRRRLEDLQSDPLLAVRWSWFN